MSRSIFDKDGKTVEPTVVGNVLVFRNKPDDGRRVVQLLDAGALQIACIVRPNRGIDPDIAVHRLVDQLPRIERLVQAVVVGEPLLQPVPEPPLTEEELDFTDD